MKKLYPLVVAALGAALSPVQSPYAERHHFSDVAWQHVNFYQDAVCRDSEMVYNQDTDLFERYGPLRLKGRTYTKGVFCFVGFVPSLIVVDCAKHGFTRFTADFGIVDNVIPTYCEWCFVPRPGEAECDADEGARPACFSYETWWPNPRCPETGGFVCIGAGVTLRIVGRKGSQRTTLFGPVEIYRWQSTAISVDVAVAGFDQFAIELSPTHTEQLDAPYRYGLPAPINVGPNNWWDQVNIVNAFVYSDISPVVVGERSAGVVTTGERPYLIVLNDRGQHGLHRGRIFSLQGGRIRTKKNGIAVFAKAAD